MKNRKVRKNLSIFVVFVICCSCLITTNLLIQNKQFKPHCTATLEDNFSDNEVIVVLTKKETNKNKAYDLKDFPNIDLKNISYLNHDLDGINQKNYKTILKLELNKNDKKEVLKTIKKLENMGSIYSAEPNYIGGNLSIIPDDPVYLDEEQWAIDKINLPKAWDICTGSASVKVGIIDSGIDSYNFDLSSRIDVTLSEDFTSETNDPFSDMVGHGTHVAGIIGAASNNGYGVTGVCWNVSLVSLKAVNSDEGFETAPIIEALNSAREKNIPIVNMSLGIPHSTAFQTAVNNYPGLIVCAAGNSKLQLGIANNYVYPGCYNNDNVICVGASTKDDEVWSDLVTGSNISSTYVDLFAPGKDIMSTYLSSNYSMFDNMTGTSMASPFVAGVAALILSEFPNFTTLDLRASILNNVDTSTNFSGKCVTGGRLNAYNSLKYNKHNYSINYTNLNAQKHSVECSECGDVLEDNHSYSYIPLINGRHRMNCACGYQTTALHAIDPYNTSSIVRCIYCGAIVDTEGGIIGTGSINDKVSINGSILSANGYIILMYIDREAYENGTLIFYDSNNLPETE